MLRYRLLTLLIVLALGPPLLAGGYSAGVRYVEWRERQNEIKQLNARFAPKNHVLAIGWSSELNIWPDREEPQMFRFTIRNVLWLTVVVGLAVGWYVDRVSSRRTVRIQAEKLAAVRAWLAEAEDLLASERVVRGEGQTIHTTPEHARRLLAERKIHR